MTIHYDKLDTKNCHIHAILQKRLDAVHKLRFPHDIKTLRRVLGVNRSTYYKHYYSEPSDRTKQKQEIARLILQIYADCNKRLGLIKSLTFFSVIMALTSVSVECPD